MTAPSPARETLFDRIDPALAVDRALTAAERTAFLEFCLVGQFDGAQPADWIAEAQNGDAYAEHIDRWWRQSGDLVVAYLTARHELPEPVTRALLSASLYAVFGIASATIGPDLAAQGRRTYIELASGAALWVRGQAEAYGWQPQHDTA